MRHLGRLSVLGAFGVACGVGGALGGVAGAQTPAQATDVCTLLRVKEVEKTLGQPVAAGTPSSRELPGTSGVEDRCTWETSAPNTGFLSDTRLQLVLSLQSNCAQPDPKGCFKSDKQLHESKHEEKDLKKIQGRQAFYVFTGEVEVLVGKRILNVHFNNFDTNMFGRKDFERRTVDAAKNAVKRL
jgi:hypothetical protein